MLRLGAVTLMIWNILLDLENFEVENELMAAEDYSHAKNPYMTLEQNAL